jgi:hypothetical protein
MAAGTRLRKWTMARRYGFQETAQKMLKTHNFKKVRVTND